MSVTEQALFVFTICSTASEQPLAPSQHFLTLLIRISIAGTQHTTSQRTTMAADDTEGAATAPCSMLCCSHLSLTKHHLPSASWVHLLLAVTILTAPIITALHPADGSPHGHTNQPLEEDHKAHFGPHLHGPDVLPDGSQWLLFQEHWRVVGNRLATPNFTAALEDAAGIIYSQYSFHGVYAGSHVSHAAPVFLDGQPGEAN